MTGTVPARAGSRPGGWFGIAFAVLYVAGMLAIAQSPSDVDEDRPRVAAAQWRDWYSDSGHRWTVIIGFLVLLLAVLALVVFAAHLRARIAAQDASPAATIAWGGALLFGAMTLVGATAMAWIPGAKEFGNSPLPTGSINYLTSQLGFAVLLGVSSALAALFVGAASWGARRGGTLPGWLAVGGIVVAVIVLILGVFFLPMILVPLWALVTGIVVLRGRAGSPA